MASITSATKCGRCGKLFGQHPQHTNGAPGRWEVGHVIDGNNLGPLVIEHSTCNRRAGGRLGAARRTARSQYREAAERPAVGPHHPMHFDLQNAKAATAAPCLRRHGVLCDVCADFLARNPHHR